MTRFWGNYHRLILGVAALGLALAGQIWLDRLHSGLVPAGLFVGALLLALFAFRGQSDVAYDPPSTETGNRPPQRWWLWLMLLAPLGLGGYALLRLDPNRPSSTFWMLHIASLVSFVVVVLILDRWSVPPRLSEQREPWYPSLFVLVAIILGAALFLRLYKLADYPFGVWFDEANSGLTALQVLEDPTYRPIFVSAIYGPSLYIYLVALMFSVLGPTVFALRLASAVLGVLSVPAAYFAGRELFGRRGGLVAAFLMAVAHWNVNFSRIGMFNISPPLFELLAVGFLLRGIRRRRAADFAWSGLCLGLGFDFYVAFQLFIVAAGLYLAHQIVTRRGFLRQYWPGLLLLAVGVALLIAPIGKYALAQPEVYFGRARGLSILAEVPRERLLPALLENIRVHLLMFNVAGDSNGRHNLPGAPMLVTVVGALFALGVGLSLSRLHRSRASLLLIWFLIMLAGGFLALTFEAPQASRSIGAQPATLLLAVVPLHMLWREWDATYPGRRYPRLFVWPLLLLMLPVLWSNYTFVFKKQMTNFEVWKSFSTPETIAARLIATEDPATQVYVSSFFHGHPTIRFLARNAPPQEVWETDDHLPLHRPADRNILLLVEADRPGFLEEARKYYPNAQVEEVQPPFGGPTVLNVARLATTDLAALQGVRGVYYAGTAWEGKPLVDWREPQIAFTWPDEAPLPAPFAVEWSSILTVEAYGRYQLVLDAPSVAELYLDETLLAKGEGRLITATAELAAGNHTLRVRALSGDGEVALKWRPDGAAEASPIPPWLLSTSPVSNNGLLGRYFPNGDWEEPVAFMQIDPRINLYFHHLPLPRPYTVEWTGKIAIPQAGNYGFGVESIDDSEVYIDGKLVASSPESNQYDEGTVNLDVGLHDIRIRFGDRTNHTHINLYWRPPGHDKTQIPPEALFPPMGSYERIVLSDLHLFEPLQVEDTAVPAASADGQVQPVDVEVLRRGLVDPRGMAVGPEGRIFVTDAGAQQVIILAPDGQVLKKLTGGDAPFSEPVDAAVDATGTLYVLDATAPALVAVSADGSDVAAIPVHEDLLGRSRGIGVDEQGRVWVAVTSAQAVVQLDAQGQELARYSTTQVSREAQPVDVAVQAQSDGSRIIWVTTVGPALLIAMDAQGNEVATWSLRPANSIDGPHLVVGPDGVYATQPELGRIARFDLSHVDTFTEFALPAPQEGIHKVVGLGVSPDGALLAADSDHGLVLRLVPPQEPER